MFDSLRTSRDVCGAFHMTSGHAERFSEFQQPAGAEGVKDLALSEQEYARRLQAAQRNIARQGLEGLVCTFMPNISYLSGYETLA